MQPIFSNKNSLRNKAETDNHYNSMCNNDLFREKFDVMHNKQKKKLEMIIVLGFHWQIEATIAKHIQTMVCKYTLAIRHSRTNKLSDEVQHRDNRMRPA